MTITTLALISTTDKRKYSETSVPNKMDAFILTKINGEVHVTKINKTMEGNI